MNEDALDSYRPVCLGTLTGLITIIAAGVAHSALGAEAQSDLEKRGEALINSYQSSRA